ncbi:unnamed protein product [Adineta ricciae]|uniref:EGF-like domain-containing protein n=1 Tax=Adineta ricciae TaxID=249248 RepID=A0A814WYG7_ADIRI|nr:unnamed protein product [Adineta ricciae]CAF1208785.1 unnamed protein product [Adineta ricciae]
MNDDERMIVLFIHPSIAYNAESLTSTRQLTTILTTIRTTTTEKSSHSTSIIQSSTFVTTIRSTSIRYPTSQAPVLLFIRQACPNQTYISIHCNISATPCEVVNLCQNGAIVYIGTCNQLINDTFDCTCAPNWTGIYCENVSYENTGVCRSLLSDYQCECLDEAYFARHCETSSKSILRHKVFSKVFASIATVALGTAMAFVVIMDVLEYLFKIDSMQKYTPTCCDNQIYL